MSTLVLQLECVACIFASRSHAHSLARRVPRIVQEAFAKEGLNYSMEGQTGNTLNSHRLIALAGQQGLDKQDKLVELLFKAYFTQVQQQMLCPLQHTLASLLRPCIARWAYTPVWTDHIQ